MALLKSILALVSYVIFVCVKVHLSRDYLDHCAHTKVSLFDHQKVMKDLTLKNQTMLDAIEEVCEFYMGQKSFNNKVIFKRHEKKIKQTFQEYLNEFELILYSHEGVFFNGYFTLAKEDSDQKILDDLKEILLNRTKSMQAMDFNDKRPFDVVVEHKKLQDAIEMLMKVVTLYLQELSEEFEETSNSLMKYARLKAERNYDVCLLKVYGEWVFKEGLWMTALFAIMKPCNLSYTVYFLSVLIVQILEHRWNYMTLEVIKEGIFAISIEATMERVKIPPELTRDLPAEFIKSQIPDFIKSHSPEDSYNILYHKIPNPYILYCPWSIHFVIMLYCLTFIDFERINASITRFRRLIFMIIQIGPYLLSVTIKAPVIIWNLGNSICAFILRLGISFLNLLLDIIRTTYKGVWSLFILTFVKIKEAFNKLRRVRLVMDNEEVEEPIRDPNLEEVAQRAANHQNKLQHFECPVCMELMEPPRRIFSCTFGHLICSICLNTNAIKACPICREDFKRNIPKPRPQSEELLALIQNDL